jgi:hypothetical protein
MTAKIARLPRWVLPMVSAFLIGAEWIVRSQASRKPLPQSQQKRNTGHFRNDQDDLAQDCALINLLQVDPPDVNPPLVASGDTFYYTVQLDHAAITDVALHMSLRAILPNGRLGFGFSRDAILVPAGQLLNTFTETASDAFDQPLPPGCYLLQVSQADGTVSQAAVLDVLSQHHRQHIYDVIYTPIERLNVVHASSAQPAPIADIATQSQAARPSLAVPHPASATTTSGQPYDCAVVLAGNTSRDKATGDSIPLTLTLTAQGGTTILDKWSAKIAKPQSSVTVHLGVMLDNGQPLKTGQHYTLTTSRDDSGSSATIDLYVAP